MDLDGSILSESVCSDDTEYLLGQNVSLREIEDTNAEELDIIPSMTSPVAQQQQPQIPLSRSKKYSLDILLPSKTNKQLLVEQKRIENRSTKQSVRGARTDNRRHEDNGQHSQAVGSDLQNESRGKSSNRVREYYGRTSQHNSNKASRKMLSRSVSSGSDDSMIRESSRRQSPKQYKKPSCNIQRIVISPESEKRFASKKNKGAVNVTERSPWEQPPSSPPTKDHSSVRKAKHSDHQKVAWRNTLPSERQNKWETDSEPSTDIILDARNALVDTGDELGEVRNQVDDEEEEIDSSIMEKLKELNLAVNFDENTDDFYDDKVREGAVLLSKLFGGTVENYYSSASDHSKSSLALDGSRTESQTERSRETSSTSTKSERMQNSVKSGSKFSETFSDTSYSPERRKDAGGREGGSEHHSLRHPKQKEVRFSNDFKIQGRSSTRDNHIVEVKGEFVKETSAFRAAMDYDDDDDDDNEEIEDVGLFGDEQRGRFLEEFREHGSDRERVTSSRHYKRDSSHPLSSKWSDQEKAATKDNMAKDPHSHRRAELFDDKDGDNVYNWKHPEVNEFQLDKAARLRDTNGPERTSRYSVEKYSTDDYRKPLSDSEPMREMFVTSTPHKSSYSTTYVTASPARGRQIEESEFVEKDRVLKQKLQESENKVNKSNQELRDLEFYIEEANSRKKMVLEEIRSLEESLKRNTAEMKSSEDLAEEYRQQATKTRSELMDLEKKKEQLQQELKEMGDLLASQRQEAMETIKMERTNEKKVMELTLERDQLHTDLESLKTQLHESETLVSSERQVYLKKIGVLQDQLHEEQRSSKEAVSKLKEQLEEERKKARDSHYERISAIHKLQDEAKEVQNKEIESLRERLARERESELEAMEEKMKREHENFNQKLQDRDFLLSQLKDEVESRENEIKELRSQMRQDKQQGFEKESSWREHSEQQEDKLKSLKAEVDVLKQQETSHINNQRKLEKLVEEKELELRRHEERSTGQIEELQNVIGTKEEEIQMIRGLVRQQEDATRQLGEELRNEAKEHIRSALDKEREAAEQGKVRHQAKLDEMKEKYENVLRQLRNDLEAERNAHHQVHSSLNKVKKEVERLRNLNLQAEEEKLNAVSQARSNSKEEMNKMKSKLEELTDMVGKSERETLMELHEEYRRNLSILGDSPNRTTRKNLSGSFLNESSGSTVGSPTREALSNLKTCNDELRQHLLAARRELEQQKKEVALRKEATEDVNQQQIVLFKKALKSKDDEISRLKRQILEEAKRTALQIKSERAAYQKVIDRLEREKPVSSTPSSSPVVNGVASPSESGMGTSFSSAMASPSTGTSPRTGDDSTTKLLRHLQGRVQQLRAQNENLRKSSDDSLNDSQSSIGGLSFDSSRTEQDVDASARLQRLQLALKHSDDKSQKNAAMLSQKMMEMTKLQKMLTHATKENMKLERAYASLQRKIVDSSR